MKIKFITTIYSDLNNTTLGGRQSRYHHYRLSLLSLLKMTNADFVCYTSENEIQSLYNFFYIQHKISQKKLEFKVYDLNKSYYSGLINQYKNIDEVKLGDRCYELQYSKIPFYDFEDGSYDYYYWIDAGLSHSGLIPDKYLSGIGYEQYFESSLFNNKLLENLVKFTGDKFFIIGKENKKNFWEQTVNPIYYTNYDSSFHIIGGLLGGKKENWGLIKELFDKYVNQIIPIEKKLYFEEHILTLMYFNNQELFVKKEFDVWLHENNYETGHPEYLLDNKSFYKILEELNNE